MKNAPILVTQFDVARSNDYILISLKAPSGDVNEKGIEVEEVQRIALTVANFRNLALLLSQMARHIDAQAAAAAPAVPGPAKSGRSFETGEAAAATPDPTEETAEPKPLLDAVLTRH